MTVKQIADEIGVSKQAVYKRATGKLKSVLAPYVYTEYNRTCYREEGVRIIKQDFIDNPCSTSNTEQIGANTEQSIVNAVVSPFAQTPAVNIGAPNHIQYTPPVNTEQIGNEYVSHTDVDSKLRNELDAKIEELHQKELELVKSQSEVEKLEEIINQLNQRLTEKDSQLQEQRLVSAKIDDERKVLTASLFRNNEFIEKLMRLSLSKRVFGWKNIQKTLMDSQNNIADNIVGETPIDIITDNDDD